MDRETPQHPQLPMLTVCILSQPRSIISDATRRRAVTYIVSNVRRGMCSNLLEGSGYGMCGMGRWGACSESRSENSVEATVADWTAVRELNCKLTTRLTCIMQETGEVRLVLPKKGHADPKRWYAMNVYYYIHVCMYGFIARSKRQEAKRGPELLIHWVYISGSVYQ